MNGMNDPTAYQEADDLSTQEQLNAITKKSKKIQKKKLNKKQKENQKTQIDNIKSQQIKSLNCQIFNIQNNYINYNSCNHNSHKNMENMVDLLCFQCSTKVSQNIQKTQLQNQEILHQQQQKQLLMDEEQYNTEAAEEIKTIQEIKKNIIGYNLKVQTPIGDLCGLYVDHTATNRPYKTIETHIQQDIKPLIANPHTETSETGNFSTHLFSQAENIILNSFNVTKNTHFAIPTGSGATGAFERMQKILGFEKTASKAIQDRKYSLEELRQNNEHQKWKNDSEIPVVFITVYEHHSNILPWLNIGCNLVTIRCLSDFNLDFEDFKTQLQAHKHYKTQLISFSACSNVTSQKTDLNQLEKIVEQHKSELESDQNCYFAIDLAAFSSHSRLDLSTKMTSLDYVCLSPHKNLGGSESTGVLIGKKSAYKSENPSFPGGGTVVFVGGFDLERVYYDSDPTNRETAGTPNVIGFYRAALAFKLQDLITISLIERREKHNAQYFLQQLFNINQQQIDSESKGTKRQIQVLGSLDLTYRYGVFSFNIYGPGYQITDHEGNSMFHPHYAAKLLNDFFAIQVRSGCDCAGPFAMFLMSFNENQQKQIEKEVINDKNSQIKPGWIRLDTTFTLEQYEIDYILEALKIIMLYGENLIEFYYIKPDSQFQMKPNVFKNQQQPNYNFGVIELFNKQDSNIAKSHEFPMEQRKDLFKQQIENASKIFQQPTSYFNTTNSNISNEHIN